MISAVKTFKKFKNIESPKMVSKRLYGHYLRSYEQIKNFKSRKFKSDFPGGKQVENFCSFLFFVSYPKMLPSGSSDSAFTERGAKPRVVEPKVIFCGI